MQTSENGHHQAPHVRALLSIGSSDVMPMPSISRQENKKIRSDSLSGDTCMRSDIWAKLGIQRHSSSRCSTSLRLANHCAKSSQMPLAFPLSCSEQLCHK